MNGRGAERATRVLELLGSHAKPLPAMMIARELSMPRSTTYHLLNVLKERGFVAYHQETRRWNLGAKAVEIATQSPSIGHAISILEAFDRASDHLTLKDVAIRAGLSRPATARALTQLQEHGLVVANDGLYSLGLRLAALAARIAPVDQLRTTARPFLVELRDETEETANLLVRDGDSAVYLDQVESRHSLRHAGWAGRRVPLEGSAAGSALRGAKRPQVVRDGVEAGVSAIACSISGPLPIAAAIGITGPTARMDNKRTDYCCGVVERIATELGLQLGAASPSRAKSRATKAHK